MKKCYFTTVALAIMAMLFGGLPAMADGYVTAIPFTYNPQIQIFAKSETKRPFFECSFKTKRSKRTCTQHEQQSPK